MVVPSSDLQRSAAHGRRSRHLVIMAFPPLNGGASGHTLVPGVTRPISCQCTTGMSGDSAGTAGTAGSVVLGALELQPIISITIVGRLNLSPRLEVHAFFNFKVTVHGAIFTEADLKGATQPVAVDGGVDAAGGGAKDVGLSTSTGDKPTDCRGILAGYGQLSVLDLCACVCELQCIYGRLGTEFIRVEAIFVLDPGHLIAVHFGVHEDYVWATPIGAAFTDLLAIYGASDVGESAGTSRQKDQGKGRKVDWAHGDLRNSCYRRDVRLTTGGCDGRSAF